MLSTSNTHAIRLIWPAGKARASMRIAVHGPQWVFECDHPDPHHWNMAMLDVRVTLDLVLLQKAVRHLLEHHDGLRLRFDYRDSGWRQCIANPDQILPFSCMDLAALPKAEQGPAFDRIAAQIQASLNLAEGPLVRIVLFDFGAERSGRLLIIVHHLAMDGVSWRILLDDLQSAYRQLSQGKRSSFLPRRPHSKIGRSD